MKDGLKRFVIIWRNSGMTNALLSVKRYVKSGRLQFRSGVKLKQWWYYSRNHAAEIDPYRVIWINPKSIKEPKSKPDYGNKNLSHIIEGDWDKHFVDFEEKSFYRALEKKFKHDIDWRDTNYFEKIFERVKNDEITYHNSSSLSEVKKKLTEVENVYHSIKINGYLTQEEIKGHKPKLPREEVQVGITRSGEFLHITGKHRIALAKILDLDQIAVNVCIRHKKWQEIRNQVATDKKKDISEDIKRYLNHPDIQYL